MINYNPLSLMDQMLINDCGGIHNIRKYCVDRFEKEMKKMVEDIDNMEN